MATLHRRILPGGGLHPVAEEDALLVSGAVRKSEASDEPFPAIIHLRGAILPSAGRGAARRGEAMTMRCRAGRAGGEPGRSRRSPIKRGGP
eukprot:scaffold5168_cov202-Prasinococcus_capsulatus_cf.AAC.1